MQHFPHFHMYKNHLRNLYGLRWDLKFCIFKKFPGDANVTDPQTDSENGSNRPKASSSLTVSDHFPCIDSACSQHRLGQFC